MLRFVCRAIATVLFTLAVLAALLDASRTIARDAIVTTPVVEDLSVAAPELLESLRERVGATPFAQPLFEWILRVPAWVLFGVLALAFALLGQRPRPRYRRYIRE